MQLKVTYEVTLHEGNIESPSKGKVKGVAMHKTRFILHAN